MKALGFSTSAVFLAVTTTAVTRLAASWGEGGGTRVLKYCKTSLGLFFGYSAHSVIDVIKIVL